MSPTTKMPLNENELFRQLGEHNETLKGLARSDDEIKARIDRRAEDSQAQHKELVGKFDDLAHDMRQIEWLRRDHTDLKKTVLDQEDMVRANRERLAVLEKGRDEILSLKQDERLREIEGYIRGRQEAEGRRKWLRRGVATIVGIVGAILGAVVTVFAVVEGWLRLFPHVGAGPR